MTDILSRPLTPSPDAATSTVGDETVILHLGNGTYFGLDPIGTRIWDMLKEGTSSPEICRRLSEEYRVDLPTIENDARQFLGDLAQQGIVMDG